jgi:hypothetical protein
LFCSRNTVASAMVATGSLGFGLVTDEARAIEQRLRERAAEVRADRERLDVFLAGETLVRELHPRLVVAPQLVARGLERRQRRRRWRVERRYLDRRVGGRDDRRIGLDLGDRLGLAEHEEVETRRGRGADQQHCEQDPQPRRRTAPRGQHAIVVIIFRRDPDPVGLEPALARPRADATGGERRLVGNRRDLAAERRRRGLVGNERVARPRGGRAAVRHRHRRSLARFDRRDDGRRWRRLALHGRRRRLRRRPARRLCGRHCQRMIRRGRASSAGRQRRRSRRLLAGRRLFVVGKDGSARSGGPADPEHGARLLLGPLLLARRARAARLVGNREVLRELGDIAESLPGLSRPRDQRLARHHVRDDPLLQRRELAAALLLAVLEADQPLAIDGGRPVLRRRRSVVEQRVRPLRGLRRRLGARSVGNRRADIGVRALADLEHVSAVRALDRHASWFEACFIELVLGLALLAADIHDALSRQVTTTISRLHMSGRQLAAVG